MPERLYFTDSDEANKLIAKDPMALLIGFALDQQVTVQKAFSGPLAIKERVGTLDPKKLAKVDLDPVFREKPAIHRFPGKMAERVHSLAAHIRDEYGGDAAQVWTGAKDGRRAAREPRRAAGLRGDEGQGARLRARQALQGREGQEPRAEAPDARRRGLAAGADRLPGGEAGAQGRVVEDEVRRAAVRGSCEAGGG